MQKQKVTRVRNNSETQQFRPYKNSLKILQVFSSVGLRLLPAPFWSSWVSVSGWEISPLLPLPSYDTAARKEKAFKKGRPKFR